MTRVFPRGVSEIGEYLTSEAGSYLRNVVREPRVTCETCSAPVDGFPQCGPCHDQGAAGVPLADRVASLIYAVKPDTQAYKVVKGYKGERPGAGNLDTMKALLALGLRGHAECVIKLGGRPALGWAVVPSTKGRTTLVEMVRSLARRPQDEIVVRSADDRAERDLRPDRWELPAFREVPAHVLVIDDSWVRGSHAQALAGTLKLAGVNQVSILTVARVLNPHWDPNPQFIAERLGPSRFDWRTCPWTGGGCPE